MKPTGGLERQPCAAAFAATAGEWHVGRWPPCQRYASAWPVRITVEGGLAGGQCFSLAAADVAVLLGMFLGEEVNLAGELDATQKEALEELMRQWAGLAASALKPDFGEVTLEVAMEAPGRCPWRGPIAASPPMASGPSRRGSWTAASARGARSRTSVLTRIQRSDSERSRITTPSQSPVPSLPNRRTLRAIEELLRQGNLGLLMDVELAVMLRFGSRQASFREVLELATGAVLELDRRSRSRWTWC